MDVCSHVGDDEDRLTLTDAHERKHGLVRRCHRDVPAGGERRVSCPQLEHAANPVEEGGLVGALSCDVGDVRCIARGADQGQIERCRVGGREAGSWSVVPLHGCAHSVPILEQILVPHPDLVAVVEDRAARQ